MKYPLKNTQEDSICCDEDYCAVFGALGSDDLAIFKNSNTNRYSWCEADRTSFKLPPDEHGEFSSSTITGGKRNF